VQRLLWASTGTKDPTYSDIKYIEPLIAGETVNTLPPDTLAAYRDHGRPALRMEQSIREATPVVARLKALGIDLGQVAGELEEEGIRKFVQPYQSLLASLDRLRQAG
jgi:transaldolase